MKYFLYIRKSTDEDDRQVLSLEAQEAELREFAARENLHIAEIFRESQTAKAPGRPVFNAMLEKIEHEQAQGILCWHPDRLARNSIDGGKIIYLIDTGKIQALKSPTFWFEPTPQGKFMLNIAFGQSKYFVDNLSENTKRGLRQKLRRGEYPGWAPLGYLNDVRTHTIVPDPERRTFIKKIFELYATNDYTLKDIRERLTSAGLLSKEGNKLSISNIQHILRNPVYYGTFRYKGELHEGKHEPLISMKLFEACQKVMAQRAHTVKRQAVEPVFRGLFTCEECGCAITSEKQKGHTYYRCTKKKGSCSQRYMREEALAEQITETLQKVSIPRNWMESVIADLERKKDNDIQEQKQIAQNLRDEISGHTEKLDRLLDAHLEGTLTREEYTAKKQMLLDKKMGLAEKLKDFEREGHLWLEPARKFLFRANQAETVALQRNFSEMKNFYKNLGSNRRLAAGRVAIELKAPWDFVYELNSNPDSCRWDPESKNPAKGGIHAENSILLARWDDFRTNTATTVV